MAESASDGMDVAPRMRARGRRVLKISISRPLGHRTQRSHATVALVGAPLVQDDFTRRLAGACEH